MNTRKITFQTGLFISVAIALGMLGYSTIVNHYGNLLLRTQVDYYREVINRNSSTFLLYGIVDSVDVPAQRILARLENRFTPNGTPRLVSITIVDGAYIAHQELTGHDGVFDSVSQQQGSLADIQPNDRIAFFNKTENERFTTSYVVFGNPL